MDFNMLAYSLFDILYMTSLMLAVGEDPEDIIKDWEENPTTKTIESLARLPHLGRYFSLLSELSLAVAGLGYGGGTAEAIPLAAIKSFGGNLVRLGKDAVSSDTDVDPADIINASRIGAGAPMRMLMHYASRNLMNQVVGQEYLKPLKGQAKGAAFTRTMGDTGDHATYIGRAGSLLRSVGMLPSDKKDLWNLMGPAMQKAIRGVQSETTYQPPAQSLAPAAQVSTPEPPKAPSRPSQDVVGDIANQGILNLPEGL
mgnify:CR=1 FL=1